ncbi:MAG: prepilin-type N-terminal cleavage/methylation domain-containing protein [Betaproteobacteria bacterium]|nr:prepilin-type N-terminal cleavage/methylation domain-containing protein [Betaproteobacteria bacterium]
MPLPALPPRTLRSRSQRINGLAGFTLIEMAVALVVVALLLGSLLAPLSSQVEQRKISEAQKILEQINDALMGFAMSQTPARLPCPDTDIPADGLENTPCVAASIEGAVPWATLGVPATDPWGQLYRYRVTGTFAAGPILLTSTGNLRVCTINTCGAGTLVATNVPAVVFSTGPVVVRVVPSPDEVENTNNNADFVSRTFSSVAGSEFDDVVTWISDKVLLNRLVAAGKLP